MHDKTYLHQTIKIFTAAIDQIHAAVDRGLVRLSQVQPAVNVDKLGQEYAPGTPLVFTTPSSVNPAGAITGTYLMVLLSYKTALYSV